MVWCRVAWGVVGWYGVLLGGMVWCVVWWYGVLLCVTVWYGVVWYGMVWYDVIWCGMVWYGVVWSRNGGMGSLPGYIPSTVPLKVAPPGRQITKSDLNGGRNLCSMLL